MYLLGVPGAVSAIIGAPLLSRGKHSRVPILKPLTSTTSTIGDENWLTQHLLHEQFGDVRGQPSSEHTLRLRRPTVPEGGADLGVEGKGGGGSKFF